MKNNKSKKKNTKKKNNIPSYSIINNSSFSSVKFSLNKDDGIYCNSGMMKSMDSHIETETNTQGGIIKGLFRELLTDASMFMTKYTGTKNNSQVIFGSFLPGDIYPLLIKPGKKFLISHHSLVCYTPNLKLGTKSKLKGLFVGEGMFQTEIKNESEKEGMVWLAAYGGYHTKELKENESFKLDNGLFLCAESDIDYSISKLGNIKTAITSGERFLMKFNGKCKVVYTNGNVHLLQRFIARNSSANKD